MEQFSFETIIDILRRRKWVGLTVLSVLVTLTVALVIALPSIYTAGAFILVEQQQIPETLVRPTVTSGAESRVQSISQEILSRSRLEALIKRFGLYQDLQRRQPMDEVIAAMRRDIRIEIKNVDPQLRMRQNTNAIAFSVSYSGTDPQSVMLVANTLASFYVEENLKAREKQATGTTQFLATQLEEVRKNLEEQEKRISQFKERYLGELPQQMDANLKTLDRLQVQGQGLSDQIQRAQDRRAAILQGDLTGAATGGKGPDSLTARLEALNRELTQLRTTYSEKYPDIARLKREIAAIEEQLAGRGEEASKKDGEAAAVTRNALAGRQQQELAKADADLRTLNDNLAKVRRDIAAYQRMIENAPRREQELNVLTRDYLSQRELYASLLKRQEEANLAESMEQRQKGEQFRILDPATFPEKPAGPQRGIIFLVGLVLALGLSGAAVMIREKTDTPFHHLEELKAFSRVPILIAIPQIVTELDRLRERNSVRLRAALLAGCLVVLAGSSYLFASGNEEMVRLLMKPTGGLQLSRNLR